MRATIAGLAALVAVTAVHARPAAARGRDARPMLQLRHLDWIAPNQVALGRVNHTAALTARVDAAPHATGVALGMTELGATWARDARAGVELAAQRTSGLAPGTYVGPRVAVDAPRAQVSLGWMFDVSDPRDGHAQLGVALGF